MAVISIALTTLANLKEELKISVSTYDDRLEKIINRVSAWIERETNRKLKARNYNGIDTAFSTTGITSEDYIFFDGGDAVSDGREFYLPQFPVQRSSVSGALAFELSYLSNRGSSGDTFTALTEGQDYVVDYDNGIVRLLTGRFTRGIKNYRVKCTAGYVGSAQPHIPDDLEQLCLDFCRAIYKDKRNLQSESIGSWSRTFNTNKEDPLIADTLALYTRF